MEKNERILNLMQFARKAGKLTGGTDACLRELHKKHLHLVIIAQDAAERTQARIRRELSASGQKIQILVFGQRDKISAALGMPLTAVFGISDKNFATKMIEYWQA
ncbi:MAG: ribosomal L7Ae/L30e/S12e/Gadd45 family protein [Candidatus Cloacimonetes bacterium]|nr:ribosomal L7Ae/L30e/S12e/Gadd45 family protein [Candidatus Cloacimonadota bacterium]